MWTHKKISPTKTILYGFCILIIIGMLLLLLPISTKDGRVTSPVDALFTATSATCVTGLIRYDTYSHWSVFGQLVILALIQIGGIGFMTFAISIISFTKRKIGLEQRFIMQEAVAAPQVGGIVKMTKFILFGTIFVEGTGALLLSLYFCPKFGFGEGLYFSVFHSISAFCNAGFDLMGAVEPSSSLMADGLNWYINFIIMALIIIGGLGFFVWLDILKNRFRFREFKLHTKMVISITIILIIVGMMFLFLLEQNGKIFEGKNIAEQGLISLFQSVAPRTAGFNTVDLSQMREGSQMIIICLMLIGGSPGSTAGGVKTTTLGVLTLSILATWKKKKSIECFKRRIDNDALRTASCVIMMYIILVIVSAITISVIDNIPMQSAMFETASAIGTVGLTLGITAQLSIISEIILVVLMIFGRVGSITILLALSSDHRIAQSQLPLEKVQIG